ncbi:MAG: hypothetical protein GY743_03395, partial [Planctomycetaceae bacterium]|nr:hypothetical protein [Planctomycetaceae bacterium]
GETNLDYDAGLINTTSTEIGDYVWEDKNGNGIQDAGEPPVSGVQVTLTGTTGNGTAVSQTATTDVDGLYLFSNLSPGTYQLTFGKPTGYEFTYSDEGTDDSVDSDVDPVTGMTINEVLESGETNLDYDAGLINTTSTEIGDYVWEDNNGNGLQDVGELGVSGVLVSLTGTTGNGTAVSQTATTDVDGLYLFSNLIPGTYQLTFGKPT